MVCDGDGVQLLLLLLFQLQKSKEREERLEEVIQAYEKIHLEKSNVQRDLDKMVNTHTHYTNFLCDGGRRGYFFIYSV